MSKKPIYGIPVGGGGGSCQPDWNQTDETKDDYIKNKPELTAVAVDGNVVEIFDADTKVDKITSSGGMWSLYAVNPNSVQTRKYVATSGTVIAGGYIPQYWGKDVTDGSPNSEPAGKGVLISSTPTRDFHVATKKYVDEKHQEALEVANGKTQSFTITDLTALGTIFNIDTTTVADEYTITTTEITHNDIAYTLKQGDIFWIVDTSVPDYWVSINDMKLYKMETTKVDLTEYATTEYVDTVANNLSATTDLTETTITLAMVSNIEYHCTNPVESLTIESFAAGTEGIAEQWSIIFTTADTITISYPDTVKWAVADPVFEGNKIYWLSFIPFGSNYLGVWTVAEAEVTTSES